jgi:hypothetical protein
VLQNIDRRERLRRLALETIDLAKDPYYMRNHLGQVLHLQPAWYAHRVHQHDMHLCAAD